MTQNDDAAVGVDIPEPKEPRLADGPLPQVPLPPAEELSDRPLGAAAGAEAWCRATSRANHLIVKKAPNMDSPSLGKIMAGDSLAARWNLAPGAYYSGCGGTGSQWVPVWYEGGWRYLPSLCVDWVCPR